MNKLLVILGPTSTGKTDIGIQLAKKLNGEIISADSRQVYKKLDIGTGKMPTDEVIIKKGREWWEIDGVRIWMYDVASPKRQYTIVNYINKADKIIWGIKERGRIPILVGGTGLYIKGLIEGLSNLSIPLDRKLRKNLQTLSLVNLQNKLKQISEERWKKMNYSDQQNPRRLIRAIELELGKDDKKNDYTKRVTKEFDVLRIGLIAPKEILYKRSDERVTRRINQGMLQEAEKLYKEGVSIKRMKQLGLEYGILADFLEGKIKTKGEFTSVLQNKIHGYIRRQLTWFKKERNIFWFDISKKDFYPQLEKKVSQWYH